MWSSSRPTNATASPPTAVVAKPAAVEAGPTTSPTVTADKMTFDNGSKTFLGEGNAVMQDKDVTLVADRVRFNKQTNEAWAEGHVRVNQAAQEWVAPSAYYNFATRRLKADEARGFVDPLYLHVQNLEQVGTNHYVFARSTVTTSDLEHPGYHLKPKHGERGRVTVCVLHDATVHLGEHAGVLVPARGLVAEGRHAAGRGHGGRQLAVGMLPAVQLHVEAEQGHATDGSCRRADGARLRHGRGPAVPLRRSAAHGLLTGYYHQRRGTERSRTMRLNIRPQPLPRRVAAQAVFDQ